MPMASAAQGLERPPPDSELTVGHLVLRLSLPGLPAGHASSPPAPGDRLKAQTAVTEESGAPAPRGHPAGGAQKAEPAGTPAAEDSSHRRLRVPMEGAPCPETHSEAFGQV